LVGWLLGWLMIVGCLVIYGAWWFELLRLGLLPCWWAFYGWLWLALVEHSWLGLWLVVAGCG